MHAIGHRTSLHDFDIVSGVGQRDTQVGPLCMLRMSIGLQNTYMLATGKAQMRRDTNARGLLNVSNIVSTLCKRNMLSNGTIET